MRRRSEISDGCPGALQPQVRLESVARRIKNGKKEEAAGAPDVGDAQAAAPQAAAEADAQGLHTSTGCILGMTLFAALFAGQAAFEHWCVQTTQARPARRRACSTGSRRAWAR